MSNIELAKAIIADHAKKFKGQTAYFAGVPIDQFTKEEIVVIASHYHDLYTKEVEESAHNFELWCGERLRSLR